MSLLTIPGSPFRRSPAARVFTHLRRRAATELRGLGQECRDIGRIAVFVARHFGPPVLRQLRQDICSLVALALFLAGWAGAAIALAGTALPQ